MEVKQKYIKVAPGKGGLILEDGILKPGQVIKMPTSPQELVKKVERRLQHGHLKEASEDEYKAYEAMKKESAKKITGTTTMNTSQEDILRVMAEMQKKINEMEAANGDQADKPKGPGRPPKSETKNG